MKKIIVTTVLALIGFAATAQTVDYTGVSINTERVKKTYPTHMAVLVTGAPELIIDDRAVTGELGARFVWAQHFGFYVGAEIGVQGLPKDIPDASSSPNYYGDMWNISGNRVTSTDGSFSYYASPKNIQYRRATLSVGGVLRLSKVVDLYLGSGVTFGSDLCQYAVAGADLPEIDGYLKGKTFAFRSMFVAPTVEAGAYFYVGHVALMAGVSFVPAEHDSSVGLRLGVGYKF